VLWRYSPAGERREPAIGHAGGRGRHLERQPPTTADGSKVELRIFGHKSGGTQRTVEIGAVEWNAATSTTITGFYYLRARYYDQGTGRLLRARYYDQATGRFLSRDPVDTGNRYSYVDNSSPNAIDPMGLCAQWERILGICKSPVGQLWDSEIRKAANNAAEEGKEYIHGNAVFWSVMDLFPIPGPYGVTVGALAWGFTQWDIELGNCSTQQKRGYSILNASNFAWDLASFGLGKYLEGSTLTFRQSLAAQLLLHGTQDAPAGGTLYGSLTNCGGGTGNVGAGSNNKPGGGHGNWSGLNAGGSDLGGSPLLGPKE
jgi:hypothetical protein